MIALPFSRSTRQPSCSASTAARWITYAGMAKAHPPGVTADGSSITASRSSTGRNAAAHAHRLRMGLARLRLALAAMAALSILAMTAPRPGHPRLLWNVTPSVPIGLYWIASAAPIKGQLAVVRLPDPLRCSSSRSRPDQVTWCAAAGSPSPSTDGSWRTRELPTASGDHYRVGMAARFSGRSRFSCWRRRLTASMAAMSDLSTAAMSLERPIRSGQTPSMTVLAQCHTNVDHPTRSCTYRCLSR
jgi:hypothetical protein